MKQTFLLSFLFIANIFYAQDKQTATFGKPSYQEINMTSYPEDLEASGLVFFEKGNYYFELVDIYDRKYTRLIKEVYRKIKVFDAKKFLYIRNYS